MNPITYAYLGDAVYELYIRKYLISLNITKASQLNKKSLDYVSAKSQRRHFNRLIDANFLTSEEVDIFKNGRNAHGGKAKNTDIITYRIATGLECLIGYLYVSGNISRIDEIMDFIVRE